MATEEGELEILERLQRLGTANGVSGLDRSVGLYLDRQPVEVGPLTNASLLDDKVRPEHGVVDRVHANQVNREILWLVVRLSRNEPAAAIHPEVQVEGPVP